MSYIKILIHCVWSTKNREPMLADRKERLGLFEHILDNAREKNIFINCVGGDKEHVHCMLSLGSGQNIAQVIQLIKGEAAHWFNGRYPRGLQWQDDYFAVSVGASQVESIRAYIHNQEDHHRRKTFQEEYNEFIEKYKFDRLG